MWIYNEEEFNPEKNDIGKYHGFVYVIEEKTTGMKYIGKKGFWRSKILPVTKSRKRRKHTLVESDWATYYGSNTLLKENVKEQGEDIYNRVILRLCKTKGEMSYFEAKEQFDKEVLLRDDYYNAFIGCRIHSKHLKL